jgi:hypothetical protein
MPATMLCASLSAPAAAALGAPPSSRPRAGRAAPLTPCASYRRVNWGNTTCAPSQQWRQAQRCACCFWKPLPRRCFSNLPTRFWSHPA